MDIKVGDKVRLEVWNGDRNQEVIGTVEALDTGNKDWDGEGTLILKEDKQMAYFFSQVVEILPPAPLFTEADEINDSDLKAAAEWYAQQVASADGWVIIHHRAFGPSCYFGPFTDFAEANEWAKTHPDVNGMFVPLYRNVDWNRR